MHSFIKVTFQKFTVYFRQSARRKMQPTLFTSYSKSGRAVGAPGVRARRDHGQFNMPAVFLQRITVLTSYKKQ